MLRVLHIEDNDEDAFLIEELVRQEGIHAKFFCVKTDSEFSKALEETGFDVILADSPLPDFDGIAALKIVRKKYPAIPFICFSGTCEPAKIKANFDLGATDFIPKTNLPRLMEALRLESERHR